MVKENEIEWKRMRESKWEWEKVCLREESLSDKEIKREREIECDLLVGNEEKLKDG